MRGAAEWIDSAKEKADKASGVVKCPSFWSVATKASYSSSSVWYSVKRPSATRSRRGK